MKYWEKTEAGLNTPVEKEISKENIVNILKYIDLGYLPNWNYESAKRVGEDKSLSLPNEHYPLHVAMKIAIQAVETQGEDFFEKLDKEYAHRDEQEDTV